jgi:transcriptional antiterminator Rof (Rho-off)
MNKPYQPILCSLHDEYEVAIMHQKKLNIQWLDDAGISHREKVLPTDILVNNKEEFLLAAGSDNKELCIRLDRITLLE